MPYTGQELIFHQMRTTLSDHPQLEFQTVLPGVDVVLQLHGVSTLEAEAAVVKDKVVHLHTSSREALLNFSFQSYGAAVPVDGFFFTIFLSSQEVELWNFTRFCWDLTSEVEHLSKHGQGQEVLLQHRPAEKGFPSRSRAATFYFHSAENFLVSITKGDADDSFSGMDISFSGQNLVGDLCEASGKLKAGMFVEIIRGEYRGYRGTVDISNGQFKVKLVNGTKLQVGEMYCRPLEEDIHLLEKEWQSQHLQGRCEGLVDVQRTCSKDGCTVLLAPEEVTCEDFCQAHHLHCNQAWGLQKASCDDKEEPVPCTAKMRLRGEQLLCRCQDMKLSRLGQEVPLGAHILLENRAAVVSQTPDLHGHLEVETPRLVTLHSPWFDVVRSDDDHDDGHDKTQRERHQVSCEAMKQGQDVLLTDGRFKGHRGAMMSCDPVSREYRVMLQERLRVHAIEVRVVRCDNLQSFGQSCSADHCEVRPEAEAESCHSFCTGVLAHLCPDEPSQRHDLRCLRAWDSDHPNHCERGMPVPCDAGLSNKVCECTPDVFEGGCFQNDVSFSPLNMKDQLRSQESSAKACAQRCASVVGCAHFSYWTDGGCHLQDRNAKLEESRGLISGPPDCLADSDGAGVALAAFDGHGGSQCEEGISYRPLDMHDQLRTKEPSLADCAARCLNVASCAHFSYWLDGGCHLQDHHASKQGSTGAISGPPSGCAQALRQSPATPAAPTVPAVPEVPASVPHDHSNPCGSLVDVEHFCSVAHGSCQVMVHDMSRRSCFDYCEQQRSSCISAAVGGCHENEKVDCATITGSQIMTCHCQDDKGNRPATNAAPTQSEFHCHSGDRSTWSSAKRWWCCRELEMGCELMAALRNCSGDAKFWSQEKKSFCCQEHGICEGRHFSRQAMQTLKVTTAGTPALPWLMQGFREPRRPRANSTPEVSWLTRRSGLVALSILAGVSLLSLFPLFGRCQDKGRESSTKERWSYMPVATEED